MHFETTWNEAESMAKSYTTLSRKEILGSLRKSLDDLADSEKSEEYHKAMGEVLFGLCSLCAHLEVKQSIIINSAVSLEREIEKRRSVLLDPQG
jgi:hypothetical protein